MAAGQDANRLGAYLRARRGLVSPEQAGIPPGGTRRVRGLRREEVALLAGISADYYLRLERGRDAHPSTQVLDALARVLRLDEVERLYLHSLATSRPRSRPRRATSLGAVADAQPATSVAIAMLLARGAHDPFCGA